MKKQYTKNFNYTSTRRFSSSNTLLGKKEEEKLTVLTEQKKSFRSEISEKQVIIDEHKNENSITSHWEKIVDHSLSTNTTLPGDFIDRVKDSYRDVRVQGGVNLQGSETISEIKEELRVNRELLTEVIDELDKDVERAKISIWSIETQIAVLDDKCKDDSSKDSDSDSDSDDGENGKGSGSGLGGISNPGTSVNEPSGGSSSNNHRVIVFFATLGSVFSEFFDKVDLNTLSCLLEHLINIL
jgi:hypothetical protein